MRRTTRKVVMTRIMLMLLVLPLLLGVAATAQSLYGTLFGTVTDTSGAVVPNAQVTVRNEASGDIRQTTTNGQGFFSASQLPAGSYAVKVEASTAGFEASEITAIALSGGDSKTLTIKLQPGRGTAVVQVTADAAPGLVTDTGEITSTISGKELQDMAIVGRDAVEYLKILPGTTLSPNGGVNGAAYSGETYGMNSSGINGQQGGLGGYILNGQPVDITMDGAHTYDPASVGAASPVNPNSDMTAEVKVFASNYSADNPQGPVVINTVTKSGGNTFHGEGYLYARNDVLNSNDWKRNDLGLPRPGSQYMYPGFNVGGPVIFPKLGFNKDRKRLFFFEGFEVYRQNIDAGVERASVPTTAERSGDFSDPESSGARSYLSIATIPQSIVTSPTYNAAGCAALGGLCYAPGDPMGIAAAGGSTSVYPTFNNGVLTSPIDPEGQIILNLYPTANFTPTAAVPYNFVASQTAPENSWQNIARIDYDITDNTKLFGRYNHQSEHQIMPNGLWAQGGQDMAIPAPSPIVGDNQSDSMLVSLTHVFSPSLTSESNFGYTYINFPNNTQNPGALERPSNWPYKGIFNTSNNYPNFTDFDSAWPSLGIFGYGGAGQGIIDTKNIYGAGENLTKAFRSHLFRFGAYYEYANNWGTGGGYPNGDFLYTDHDNFSGNHWADMLDGWFGKPNAVPYLESIQAPPTNIATQILDFYATDSWKLTRRLTVEGGIRFQHMPRGYDASGYGLAQWDQALYNNDPSQLNNYTGLTWHKKDNSVPLSGVDSRLLFYSPRAGAAYDLTGTGQWVIRGGFGMFRKPTSVGDGSYTQPASTVLGGTTAVCATDFYGPAGSGNLPDAVGNYTCNQFKEIPEQAQYHGDYNLSLFPFGSGPVDAGDTSVVAVEKNQDQQPLTYSYSLTLSHQLPKNILFEVGYIGNKSRHSFAFVDINPIPLYSEIGYTGSNANVFRPMDNYTSISVPMGIVPGEYDSLQTSLVRRVGSLTWNVNFTWAKEMAANDTSSVLPDYGTKFFWGVTPGNRAYALNTSYTYHVPAIPHTARALTGGWMLSGITVVDSGQNLTSNRGANYGAAGIGLVQEVGTSDFSQNESNYPLLICDPRKGLAQHQYINGNCFANPAVGQLPTGKFPYVPGPAYINSDLTLFKDIKFADRYTVHFQASGFNFLNHPLWTFENSDANLVALGTPDLPAGQTCQQAEATGAFGCVYNKEGKRIIELAAKFIF